MITENTIHEAADSFADGYSSSVQTVAYYGFKKGAEWALKQVQSEYSQKKK